MSAHGDNKMTASSAWPRFCDSAATAMEEALDNQRTLVDLHAFFTNSKAISNPALRQYVEYIIWEIGGAPDAYAELLNSFRSGLSENAIIQRLGERISKTHRWPWN
jgi:hypothetical protein